MSYIDFNYKPSKSDLVCEFYVEPASGVSLQQAAENIAAESSIGTWTDVCTMSSRIKKMGAKVFEIKKTNGGGCIKIAYPSELFEKGNMPCILSSVAGNIFGMKVVNNLRLEDIHWPYSILKSFKGPLFGIPGIRKLTRVAKRPLCGTIIKPKLGLDSKGHAKVAYQAWKGGIDIVKDDENLTSQNFNKFEKRVRETLRMKKKAEKETGEKKIYMANVSAETKEMLRRANFLKNNGNEYLMVDIMTTGWSALQTLREENDKLKLVLHAHRAMHAALTRNKKHGISMLVLADVCRLIGMDQLHIGTAFGKMQGIAEEVLNINDEIESCVIRTNSKGHVLAEDWHNFKPVFAVCSGGLHPGHVPNLIRLLGKDIIIQMGGGIHGHPWGTEAGAKAARQAIDACVDNVSLISYSKNHKELGMALKKWL